jgi:hypothetical protein
MPVIAPGIADCEGTDWIGMRAQLMPQADAGWGPILRPMA